MSIRVSEEELEMLERAAKLFSYSSYSEFVCRIALIEATKVIRGIKQESLSGMLGCPKTTPCRWKKLGG